ncbi:MAG: hypothetical protein L6R40_002862 [Gallowayella cf. fulva]|nr:MAG: hypothetical protein L6R40_002862 [Xanthomendoza cf. fulva]
MDFSHLLTLFFYLVYLSHPLSAIPVADITSELAIASSPDVNSNPISLSPLPDPALSTPHQQLVPRFTYPNSRTITFNTQSFHTRFTVFTGVFPIRIAYPALLSLYFQIQYNLSRHGEWYKAAPMNRLLIQGKDMYLLFRATDPQATVPWDLVKAWTEAVMAYMDLGGVVGFYTASFQRLGEGNEGKVDFWVETRIGSPVPLAAAAA